MATVEADSAPLRRAGHKELSPFTGRGEGKHIVWCSPWAVGHTGGGQISLGANVAGKISTERSFPNGLEEDSHKPTRLHSHKKIQRTIKNQFH